MVFTPVYTDSATVYGRTGLSATEVDLTVNYYILEQAEAETEYLTGRKFTNGNAKTDIISGEQKDILGYYGNQSISVTLSEYPIQSVTSFTTLDISGNVTNTYANLTSVQVAAGTFATTDYWLDVMNDPLTNATIPYGKVTLKNMTFQPGVQNIKVSYTYGYTSVPVAIKNLATCLAGIRCWIYFLGGNYNRLNSYSIPQQSVEKGDFYARGQQNMQSLKDEANEILDRIGRRQRILYVTGGLK